MRSREEKSLAVVNVFLMVSEKEEFVVEADNPAVVVILKAWLPTLGAVVEVESVEVAVEVAVLVTSLVNHWSSEDSMSSRTSALKSPKAKSRSEAMVRVEEGAVVAMPTRPMLLIVTRWVPVTVVVSEAV